MVKQMLLLLFNIYAVACFTQPEIGQSIEKYKRIYSDSSIYLLTSANQLEKALLIEVDSIKYSVTLNENMTIKYISTSDENFETKEHLRVGYKYFQINPGKIVSKTYDSKGWGKFLKLQSGWYAVFGFEQPINSNSSIQFFFKKE